MATESVGSEQKSWRLEESERRARHETLMAYKYRVEGHPKFSQCYELAYKYGHLSGWEAVELYFSEFVKLIK